MYTIAPPYPAIIVGEPGVVAKLREQWFQRRKARRARREPAWPPVDIERLRAENDLRLAGFVRFV
jgi:hypothetical protein